MSEDSYLPNPWRLKVSDTQVDWVFTANEVSDLGFLAALKLNPIVDKEKLDHTYNVVVGRSSSTVQLIARYVKDFSMEELEQLGKKNRHAQVAHGLLQSISTSKGNKSLTAKLPN